eukprot:SAG31_NODE_4976_length_2823_cov_1.737885_5_plen_258_part_00
MVVAAGCFVMVALASSTSTPAPQPACLPQPCPGHPGRTFCPNNPAPAQCGKPSVSHCPPGPCPGPAPRPTATARTYLALDDRNVLDSGGATLVLGRVTKKTNDLIAEAEPWEMRFDNMQPNVWYDAPMWRAWYSTFSTCKFDNATHYPGPGTNASLPLQCQARLSRCNLTAPKPPPKRPPPPPPPRAERADVLPVAKGRNGLFLYAESYEPTPTKPFVKPALGLWPWPPESKNTTNNIFLNLYVPNAQRRHKLRATP